MKMGRMRVRTLSTTASPIGKPSSCQFAAGAQRIDDLRSDEIHRFFQGHFQRRRNLQRDGPLPSAMVDLLGTALNGDVGDSLEWNELSRRRRNRQRREALRAFGELLL